MGVRGRPRGNHVSGMPAAPPMMMPSTRLPMNSSIIDRSRSGIPVRGREEHREALGIARSSRPAATSPQKLSSLDGMRSPTVWEERVARDRAPRWGT